MQLSRIFLVSLVALLSGVPASADEVIRIMAANTTSGDNSSYDPGEGNRIFQGLDPDIALVQEMNVGVAPNKNTPATYSAWVTANFGASFHYHVEATVFNGDIPNGIVSRYPIIASGEWNDTTMSNRDYVWAKIDIPGDKHLWAVSVHLSSGGGASQRDDEAMELRTYIQGMVPAGDYLVLGGDLNTTSRTEDCIVTLSSVVVTAGPYPADQAGDSDTNNGTSSRNNPYDWVIPDTDLNALKTPLVIGTRTFTNGLVFDSRVYSPLSEVSPVLATDSNRLYPNGDPTNMQHMAVMRAFLIPTNDPPVIASAANSSSTEIVTDPDLAVYEIVRGTSVGLTVAATDDAGEAALKYTWSKSGGAASPVAFSANGTNAAKNCTATFQAIGNYTLTVAVQDLPGLTVNSSVKVRVVQAAANLTLNPPSATLAVNATQAFTATLADQFNQPMAGSFTWSASGGGTFDAAGVFTATTAGGPYAVSASSGGFSDTSSITVTRAPATVSLSGLTRTYDGGPQPVTVTTTPSVQSISILYGGSSTPPTNAGSYTVTASITDPNYQGSSSGTLVIQNAEVIVEITGLAATYDGSPKPVTVSTTPSGRTFAVLYDGSPTPPVNAGSYGITATITESNYQGSASATLVIAADEWALWKNTHFTTLEQTAGLAADPADPDSDGFANLAEFAMGTHPRQFTPPLPGVVDAVGFSITFTRPANLSGIHYAAEASDDLGAWSPVPLEILIPGAVETVRARQPFEGDPSVPIFLRLRFERD